MEVTKAAAANMSHLISEGRRLSSSSLEEYVSNRSTREELPAETAPEQKREKKEKMKESFNI